MKSNFHNHIVYCSILSILYILHNIYCSILTTAVRATSKLKIKFRLKNSNVPEVSVAERKTSLQVLDRSLLQKSH